MKRIKHTLLISCLKATELIERKFHFRLSVKEKLQLKVHKMMCRACTLYEKQSAILEKGISPGPERDISTEELQRLKQTISAKLSDIE